MMPHQDPDALHRIRCALTTTCWEKASTIARLACVPIATVYRYLPTMRGVERSKEPPFSTGVGRRAYGWRLRS